MSRNFSSKDTVGVIVLAVVAVAMIVGGVKIFGIAFSKNEEQPTDSETKTVTMTEESRIIEPVVTTQKVETTEATKATTAPGSTEKSVEQIKAEAIAAADIQSQHGDNLGALVTIRMAIEKVGEDAELAELAAAYESAYQAQITPQVPETEQKTAVLETTEATPVYANDVLPAFNLKSVILYSESSSGENQKFQMCGETYRNGVVFAYDDGSITYNVVGDYSKMSFYLGHQDNTQMSSAELYIYLDNEFYESYSISSNDLPQFIEVDVRGKKTIRFHREGGWEAYYCLADLKIE